jgi:hypothetical protein
MFELFLLAKGRSADMRVSARTAIYVCLSSLCANSVVAQWNASATMNLGMGYGQIALSQSILSGTRQLSNIPPSSARGATTPDRPPPPIPDPALTYTPDPRLSERTRTAMIEAVSHNNPALHAQVEQAFAGDMVLKTFDRFMSTLGYSSRNVADDMAMLLLVSWEIATGATATASQISGADRQIHSVFSHSTPLLTLSNAERQQMAEQIAYQVILGSTANREYMRTGDQAQLAHLREVAASLMRQQGFDLRNLRLTEQGFSLKR